MTVTLGTPTGRSSLRCELVNSHLQRMHVERLLASAHHDPASLVLAPLVGRSVGERFQEARVNFIDLAGNCYLNLDDRYLARIQGQSRESPTTAGDRSLRAASYRALFALLVDRERVDAPTRDVATRAGGVSPQTVADLRARLLDTGILLRVRKRIRWAPGGWKRALDLWLAGFEATLSPQLIVGRYRARERDVEALEARLSPLLDALGAWRWGGGAAAKRLTGYYRGDRTVLYLNAADETTARRLALVPDASGSVLLLRTPGPLALEGAQEETAHPILVYADLLAEGHERAREAARQVYEKYLTHSERE